LTWPLTLEQTRQVLYRDCIDRICEEQKHIARRIVEEIGSRSLPAFNHWPDAENFTRWAIKRCTSAYYLQAFLTRFLDQVDLYGRAQEFRMIALMSKRFRVCSLDQEFLLPPSLQDWLPEDHLARFVADVVNELDLSAIYAEYENSPAPSLERKVPDAASAPPIFGAQMPSRFQHHEVVRIAEEDASE
jgi:hypothetical protein